MDGSDDSDDEDLISDKEPVFMVSSSGILFVQFSSLFSNHVMYNVPYLVH